ncbi:hypothetical protein [Bradyrhizobium sp. 170]|uniref:hypothetical protein n=1 Tax=Bradyrhizobium sp. 170 TaxID=2782641 RepID=UPI001FFF792E|nr:hypothetical protein [Bradyrhizobium sp. 170]UPK03487.1 hypothetical protein IVB05_39305 [Bradyrhizobium sp. 170]
MIEKQRQCRCGAIYYRIEAMAPSREIDSFECTVCGATLEKWDTAWVPTYRLIVEPAIEIVKPTIEIAEPAIEIAEPAIETEQQVDTGAQTGDCNAIAPDRS